MIRDVVIVGGGPVGLMLACELRLTGASVTFLEQQDELTSRRQLSEPGSLLEEYAYKLGVRLRWGHELIAREQAADGMLLHIRDQLGEYELRTRHLVECDGIVYGQSLVNPLPARELPMMQG